MKMIKEAGMKGTEKQVKWATEIRERVIATFRRAQAECGDSALERKIDALIAAIEDADEARDLISLFKGFRPSGNLNKDMVALAAVYRVGSPATEGERRILAPFRAR